MFMPNAEGLIVNMMKSIPFRSPVGCTGLSGKLLMKTLTTLFPFARHPLTIHMNDFHHVVQILLVYVLLKVILRHLTKLLFAPLPQ